ncbi:hypothetical protein BDI4_1080074 [Burkholderia diffusa]|nr:hypothetical protein BDI4_1080074 [Burkholderia diffusa]
MPSSRSTANTCRPSRSDPLTQRRKFLLSTDAALHVEHQQRSPLPPFMLETAIEKVRLAEDGWN